MILTIIIPVFNEENNFPIILKKILKISFRKQIIVIDDGSTDNSLKQILKFKKQISKIIIHKKNFGKGAAIKSAIKHIKGDIVIIQDSDLEYNPGDYKKLISPIKKKKYLVVYGSRVLKKKRYNQNNTFISNYRTLGNHLLTIASNLINKQSLTDAHTCYKVFDAKLFKSIKLYENRFNFCPEITTKISNKKIKILEVPIKYKGRTVDEGKKIRFYDAIDAIITLLKYKFFK